MAELVYLSIASLWEIAIKVETGKLKLKEDYEMIGAKVEESDILDKSRSVVSHPLCRQK